MLDDLLGAVLGEAAFGRLSRSRRAQLLLRLFFGLLGAGLGIVGAIWFARTKPVGGNPAMWLSMLALLLSPACFSLFNIGLARPWTWPGLAFVASFVSMFVTRILFGV